MKHTKFEIGNIILSPSFKNRVEIIIGINFDNLSKKKSYNCIFIDSNNCFLSHPEFTEMVNSQSLCSCYESDENSNNLIDCPKCLGTGYYKIEVDGMDKAILLASNIKEYIMDRLLKNFEFHDNIRP